MFALSIKGHGLFKLDLTWLQRGTTWAVCLPNWSALLQWWELWWVEWKVPSGGTWRKGLNMWPRCTWGWFCCSWYNVRYTWYLLLRCQQWHISGSKLKSLKSGINILLRSRLQLLLLLKLLHCNMTTWLHTWHMCACYKTSRRHWVGWWRKMDVADISRWRFKCWRPQTEPSKHISKIFQLCTFIHTQLQALGDVHRCTLHCCIDPLTCVGAQVISKGFSQWLAQILQNLLQFQRHVSTTIHLTLWVSCSAC